MTPRDKIAKQAGDLMPPTSTSNGWRVGLEDEIRDRNQEFFDPTKPFIEDYSAIGRPAPSRKRE